jgi:hypothetical protein
MKKKIKIRMKNAVKEFAIFAGFIPGPPAPEEPKRVGYMT